MVSGHINVQQLQFGPVSNCPMRYRANVLDVVTYHSEFWIRQLENHQLTLLRDIFQHLNCCMTFVPWAVKNKQLTMVSNLWRGILRHIAVFIFTVTNRRKKFQQVDEF